MAKILVTGGAGFIGGYVVKALVSAGQQVVVLDDFSSGTRHNLPHGALIEEMKGDVADITVVRKAMQGCDHVVHLAAMVSVPLSIEKPEQTYRSNVLGTYAVLEVAREQKLAGWLIYASSAAVYGGFDQPKAAEADANGAVHKSPYAASKAAGEVMANMYREVYGVKALGLRFFNVYGPGQDAASPYSGVLSKVVHSVDTGTLLPIFGDGNQTRDFVMVQDVVRVIFELLKRPVDAATPPVMNLGSGVGVSLLDMIRQVVALKRVNPRVEYKPARPGDVRLSCADITLLRQVLPHWQPMTLQTGLRMWLQAN
ncbi:MAG: NAD-dependent epimerase/dehydratase family protein [Alphaproteobacteria bacterium]|nr:MAG: NAD-dependent epimerase/dehydratase family protein [Alphaproteobacteria bacterium]